MPFLEIENLTKKFGDTAVLCGIDFSMEKGEVTAVIGSSGGGKSTFLRCLNFLEKPEKGKIRIGGRELYDASKEYTDAEIREMRLGFGLVFQSFNLFPQYTAADNISMPLFLRERERLRKAGTFKSLKKETAARCRARALELLESVGLSDKAGNYPCELSGGQCQRVAIARALALSPDILCFDEPTSALDPELTGEVLKVIKSLKNADRTMLIVTHEMAFARDVADKVVFMANGVIEEQGTPAEVFEHPKSPLLCAFLQKSDNDRHGN